MADVKVKLLDAILLPKKGGRESQEYPADAEVSVPSDVAERLVRLGVAKR